MLLLSLFVNLVSLLDQFECALLVIDGLVVRLIVTLDLVCGAVILTVELCLDVARTFELLLECELAVLQHSRERVLVCLSGLR